MRSPRRRWFLTAAAIVGLTIPSTILAAEPSDIRVATPSALLTGFGLATDLSGTWYQRASLDDGDLTVDLTLQLAAPSGTATPGPVGVFWQLQVTLIDRTFGDVSQWIIGSPTLSMVWPNCDSVGNCAMRLTVSGPIGAALDAAEDPRAGEVYLGVAFTAVRTFSEMGMLQVVQPGPAAGSAGGLTAPLDSYGVLSNTPAIATGDAVLAEVVPQLDQPANLFDFGTALADAVAGFPIASPDPVPIHVWTPERSGLRRIQVRMEFDAPCPPDRAVIIRDALEGDVAWVIFAGGSTQAFADLALQADATWSIGLVDGTGQVIDSQQIRPNSTGVRIAGQIDCSDGKGLLTEEPLASMLPNPSVAESGDPAASEAPSPSLDGEGLPILAGAALAFAAACIATYAYVSQRRRSGTNI